MTEFFVHRAMAQSVYDAKTTEFVRKNIYGEVVDTSQYISSSELGTCPRQLKYQKQPTEPIEVKIPEVSTLTQLVKDPNTTLKEGYFERGHVMEAWYIDQLRKVIGFNEELLHAYPEQVTFTNEDLYRAGTPDGVITHRNGHITVKEIKTTSSLVINPDTKHLMQLSQNMDLVSEHYEPRSISGELVYINSDNWYNVKPFRLDSTDKIMSDTRDLQKKKAEFVFYEEFADVPYTGVATDSCNGCFFKEKCHSSLASEAQKGNTMAMRYVKILKDREVLPRIAPFRDFSDPKVVEECEASLRAWLAYRGERLEYEKKEKEHKDNALSLLEYNHGKIVLDLPDSNQYDHVSIKISPVRKKMLSTEAIEEAGLNPDDFKRDVEPYYNTYVKYS